MRRLGLAGENTDDFSFSFAFALLQAQALSYLRVQDHMRKMGLARKALRQLLANMGSCDLPPGIESEKSYPLTELSDLRRSVRLFRSVQLETKEMLQKPRQPGLRPPFIENPDGR